MPIRANIAKWFLRRLRSHASKYLSDLKRLRVEKEKWFSRMRPPSGVKFEAVEVQGLKAEWCYPPQEKAPQRVLFFIHGGGYASCSPHSHWGLIGRMSKDLGIRVFAPDYRLAPENPFPAGLNDVVSIYEWLLQTYKPEDIIVAGDSAGGGLALSMLLRLKELNMPQPLTAILLSPWADLSLRGESFTTKADIDPLLPAPTVREWASWYVGEGDAHNPLISTIYADLNDLCPLFLHVGTDEILLDDAVRLHQKAKGTNTQVTLGIWEGMFHVWHMAWRFIPEATRALEEIYDHIQLQIDLEERRKGLFVDKI